MNLFNELLRSRRKFNQVIITDVPFYNENRKEVVALLNAYGHSIKRMKIESKLRTNCKIEARDWLKIFKAVPDLESLELDLENLTVVDWLNCEILQKLESLTLNLKNCEIKEFFGYFRPSLLKQLKVKSHWNEFDDFISKQLAVTDLTIHESNFNQTFDKLQLNSFVVIVEVDRSTPSAYPTFVRNPGGMYNLASWRNNALMSAPVRNPNVPNDKLINLISTHSEIKKLSAVNLIGYRGGEYSQCELRVDVIKALCHLPSLEKLIIRYDYNSTIDKEDLAQCTAKEVEVQDLNRSNIRNSAQNETLIKDILEMENIQKLKVDSLDLRPEMRMSHETLKYLKVVKTINGCDLRQLLNNFVGLEHLECEKFCYRYYHIIFQNGADRTIFPDLKCLRLNDGSMTNVCLPTLLQSLPNLEIFLLKSCNIPYQTAVLNVFSSMPKLKDITVTFSKITMDDNAITAFNALKNLCSKLKKFNITFITASQGFKDMLERELSKDYDLLKFHKRGCVLKSEKY